MIELRALNPHWLDNSIEPEYDLCVHSAVWLKVGNRIVSNEDSDTWTIGATAYLFLKSLKKNHHAEEDEQFLPHCGFNFWKIDDKINFGNCGLGINWDILHKNNKIVHKLKDEEIEVVFDDWRNAVIKFSDDVLEFYRISAPRKLSDVECKKEFEFFISELNRLRKEAFEKM